MNKKNAIIIGIIGLVLLIYFSSINNTKSKELSYYLTSPWVTERVDWYFLQLPEKWTENFSEIEKGREKYNEICNDVHMYEMNLNDFHFMCTYMDAKEGVYENWDLDKSATAILNQVLYNLKCKDINIEKLSPLDNYEEINYTASSNCSPKKYKAKMRGFRYKNHILLASVYYVDSDENSEKIAQRIMDKIENKYDEIENVKN
jgi:hypothetical protein